MESQSSSGTLLHQESTETLKSENPRHVRPSRPTPNAAALLRWQKELLPLMVIMVVALAVFFFIVSIIQYYRLDSRINQSPQLNLEATYSRLQANELESVKWETLSRLEANVLERRYHQANVLLMSRIWTRYLGFVTGMILALVGTAFILGKLSEAASSLEADTKLWKLSLTSASPGLVLAVLGTFLMITTMLTQNPIDVKDQSVYMPTVLTPSSNQPDATDISTTPPENLSDQELQERNLKKLQTPRKDGQKPDKHN